jgi:hypothetical protein
MDNVLIMMKKYVKEKHVQFMMYLKNLKNFTDLKENCMQKNDIKKKQR